MKSPQKWMFILTLLGTLSSCMQDQSEDSITVNTSITPQNPAQLKYAKGFSIDTIKGGFQKITIYDLTTTTGNPKSFVLVPKGAHYTSNDPTLQRIETPLSSVGIFSSSFVGYFDYLESLSVISAVENKNYIYNPELHKKLEKGTVFEMGNIGQINLEKLILNAPEALLVSSSSDGLDAQLEKVQKSGIAIIPCSEWQELHPLSRAEWIKFFGALLDKESLADSLFQDIEAKYMAAQNICAQSSTHPKAIFSSMYQGIWYVPGGKSYLAQLLADAQGVYPWKENNQTASLALSFEEIAIHSMENDIWINPEASSKQELLSRDSRYASILNNLTLGVFQCNARVNSIGGNDYWESGVVRPDLVLQDLGKMLHPNLFENYTFTYFKPLE